MSVNVLDARDVHVDLAGNHVVCGIDLSIAPGEFVALMGPNGSGKSTFVRAVVGLVPATGTIELFGTSLSSFRDRSRLGYVPQRPATAAGVPATVREVVASGLLARRPHLGFPARGRRSAIDAAIENVGLAHKAGRPIHELSGGQQQRAHIARALVGYPDFLVMDEPTAGVDAESIRILTRLLARLTARGTAVLMVTHEVGPLRPHLTRAVALAGGRVTHDAPLEADCDPLLHEDDAHHHAHTSEPVRLTPVPEEGPLP